MLQYAFTKKEIEEKNISLKNCHLEQALIRKDGTIEYYIIIDKHTLKEKFLYWKFKRRLKKRIKNGDFANAITC